MQTRNACLAAVLCLGATAATAADLVVVAHPSAPALSRADVADIFLGKSPAFLPVDLPEGSALHGEFYRRATGRDAAQVKATWARLVFSGKAQAPRQAPDAAAVKRAVAADPRAVGYIEKAAVDASVKVVHALD